MYQHSLVRGWITVRSVFSTVCVIYKCNRESGFPRGRGCYLRFIASSGCDRKSAHPASAACYAADDLSGNPDALLGVWVNVMKLIVPIEHSFNHLTEPTFFCFWCSRV